MKSRFIVIAFFLLGCATAASPIFSASVNDAEFVSQTVPSPMQAGKIYQVSIVIKNTGTLYWRESDKIRLGTQNPSDNTTWGLSRVKLSDTEVVAPNREKQFIFAVTAPSVPGTYSFQWRMLQEDVEWFGNPTPNLSISVGSVPPDVVPPTSPANLSATAAAQTSRVELTWDKSVDETSLSGYLVERCLGSSCAVFSQIAAPSDTKYSDSGLGEGKTYRYRVRAKDAAGNFSPYSAVVSVKTAEPPDTVNPTISILTPADNGIVGGTAVGFVAQASDNVGIAGVQFFFDGAESGSEISVFPYEKIWDSTGIATSTIVVTAVARDKAGNKAESAPVTVRVNNNSENHRITTSRSGGGFVSPIAATVVNDQNQTFYFFPKKGFRVSRLNVDGAVIEPAPFYSFGYVVGSHSISATFSPAPDAEPPVRGDVSPSGVLPAGTILVPISFTTDKDAVCKYDTSAGVAFGKMAKTFSKTGFTSHGATLSGFSPGGSYTYYVKCESVSGNANTDDLEISFSIPEETKKETTPTVKITPPAKKESSVAPVVIAYDLRSGMNNAEVKKMQTFLLALGDLPATVEANGYFGNATLSAVISYQKRNGLEPTGFVGVATRTAFANGKQVPTNLSAPSGGGSRGPKTPPVRTVLTLGMEGNDVADAQNLLKKRGYFNSGYVPNGIFDAFMQVSVRRFQCAEMKICSGDPKITGFGNVDSKTKAALLSSKKPAPLVLDQTPPFPY